MFKMSSSLEWLLRPGKICDVRDPSPLFLEYQTFHVERCLSELSYNAEVICFKRTKIKKTTPLGKGRKLGTLKLTLWIQVYVFLFVCCLKGGSSFTRWQIIRMFWFLVYTKTRLYARLPTVFSPLRKRDIVHPFHKLHIFGLLASPEWVIL